MVGGRAAAPGDALMGIAALVRSPSPAGLKSAANGFSMLAALCIRAGCTQMRGLGAIYAALDRRAGCRSPTCTISRRWVSGHWCCDCRPLVGARGCRPPPGERGEHCGQRCGVGRWATRLPAARERDNRVCPKAWAASRSCCRDYKSPVAPDRYFSSSKVVQDGHEDQRPVQEGCPRGKACQEGCRPQEEQRHQAQRRMAGLCFQQHQAGQVVR